MAITPNDAMSYAKRFVGNGPVDDTALKYRILDDANRRLWMADNFRWNTGNTEIVTLLEDTQDVNIVSALTDFQFLTVAKLITSETTGDITEIDLKIAQILPATTILKGTPRTVSYIVGTPQKMRFFPVPHYGGAAMPKVLGWYKKKAVEITSANAGSDYETTTGVPSDWFWVYQEIVLLKAYLFLRDPRAGTVTVQGSQIQYNGQYGVVEEALTQMRTSEKKIFTTLGEEVHRNG